MLTALFLLLAGSAALYIGAEGLIRGSAALALRFGIPPLIIGLTIVGYGTGTPELIVSTQAILESKTAIALGNVVGSNISNIGLILACTLFVCSIPTNKESPPWNLCFMIFTAMLLPLVALGKNITHLEGSFFLSLFLFYTGWLFYSAKKNSSPLPMETPPFLQKHPWIDVLFIVGGFAILFAGASWFLNGAIKLATMLGVSDAVIGLSVVAVGTSLPELAASLVAAVRKHGDIALGNIIGSNIFNILAIVGMVSVIKPIPSNTLPFFDYFVMIAFSLILSFLILTQKKLQRLHAYVLLSLYIGYIVYLFQQP